MDIEISGQILETETKTGVSGLTVEAMDSDLLFDELIGQAQTDNNGYYAIKYSKKESDLFEEKPDVYLIVKNSKGDIVKSTKNKVIYNVKGDVEINVDIPNLILVKAGIVEKEPVPWMKDVDPESLKKFSTWTFQPGYEKEDNTLAQIQNDLKGKVSILELMKQYIGELKKDPSNNAFPFIKMAKLFELGITPDDMNGHFYGITLGLKTGDLEGNIAEIGNIIGFLYGVGFADQLPWVGKSFSLLGTAKLDQITSDGIKPSGNGYLGINHFNQIDYKALNRVSFQILNLWMDLKEASAAEQNDFGHDKNGGNFVAYKNHSCYHATDRDVFQLNYRWKNLDNRMPFSWLIDEMVQIADGLYIGQLLFATRRVLKDYDPERPNPEYKYQHFGYFMLFDKSWNAEARRLFPFLEIPVTAPGLLDISVADSFKLPKFSTFTFAEPPLPICNNDVLDKIKTDMKSKPTIMHLLKEYSDTLLEGSENDSPYFIRLQEIFNRGIGIKEVRGFYRGALISWQVEGLSKYTDINILNRVHTSVLQKFDLWTGKSFEDISVELLDEITDGYEKGEEPTFWGANTLSLRTPGEKIMGRLIRLLKARIDPVPADEALKYGYDVKSIFFVAHQAKSVNVNCKDKTIFQFNYRWPNLRTLFPDFLCIDELVQIADGLYLGQLMYAVNVLKPYDPAVDPAEYKYQNFGYFLLMDEEWHKIRLDIGFDLASV